MSWPRRPAPLLTRTDDARTLRMAANLERMRAAAAEKYDAPAYLRRNGERGA